ncbi:MAG: methyltransferase domain-containing protein [Candidatus Thiothrix putei]|uniref:Methyltransferase domain-containing protein n=1 Tax=Candidatus Thiothrix putei TaxID=3080811 RepID=A0AA95HF64_9GAMM|nr:MAG: methyltransferase domain-containing protein [Candidatus Thiothrix putei]
MNKEMIYHFHSIKICEMCGADTNKHKLIGQRLNSSQGMKPKRKLGISVSVMQCSNCGLIYSSPQPIPNNIQDHYGIPPENYWKKEQFTHDKNYFKTEIENVKSLLSLTSKVKPTALDIGAGLGNAMLSLKSAGMDVYGLEPSIPFYERAISIMGIPNSRLKLGAVEDIEYEENFFDFITFGAVFEHIYQPSLALKKALAWLKPGGIIHIEVPSADYLIQTLIDKYFRLVGTNYTTHISPMHQPYHLYEFRLKSFQELGKNLSFTIAKHQYYVCPISPPVPKMLHPLLRRYMAATSTGAQLAVYLRKKD